MSASADDAKLDAAIGACKALILWAKESGWNCVRMEAAYCVYNYLLDLMIEKEEAVNFKGWDDDPSKRIRVG